MAEPVKTTSKVAPGKETIQDRAQAWVVDQAAKCVVELGRCPVETVATSINVPLNALLAVVQSSDRLSVVDGDLDLTICNDAVGRSLDRWCNDVIRAVGSAVRVNDLAELLTVHLGKSAESIASSIRSSSISGHSGLTVINDQILVNDWLPMFDHEDQGDILLENGVKVDLLTALIAKIGDQTYSNIQEFAIRTLDAVQNKPIRHKTLAVVYWACVKNVNPASDLEALMRDERLLWHSGAKGGRWVLSKVETEYRTLLEHLVPEPELSIISSSSVHNEPVSTETEAVPDVIIDSELIASIHADIMELGRCVDICGYGIPDDQLEDYEAIINAFDGVRNVGFHRYMSVDSIPDVDTQAISDNFTIPRVEFISEDGEQVEDLISPESYIGTLKADVLNPNNQDVLDDAPVYTGEQNGETYSFPLYKEHIGLGVIPMCRLSKSFVPWSVEYAPITVFVGDEPVQCALVNANDVRCVTGLNDAFKHNQVVDDCMATITKTSLVGEFKLELSPLVDGEYALTPERCAELDVYKESEADNPTVVILTQILDDHPKGVSFELALRELRYIRRTSVHKLASILSTNDCFAQKPGTGVWRYNPKRADAGNDIARRTYLKSGF